MERAAFTELQLAEYITCQNCKVSNSARRRRCSSCGVKLPKPVVIGEWLQQYESAARWLSSLRSPATISAYSFHLATFCRFYKVTPDKLHKMTVSEIRKKVEDYIFHMKRVAKPRAGKKIANGELSVNSVPDYTRGIKSFLEFHEITLPWKKFKTYFPDEVDSNLRSHSTEEVIKLVKFADIHDKPVVYTAMSAGVRRGAMSVWKSSMDLPAALRFRDIIPIPDEIYQKIGVEPFGLAFLDVYPESRSAHYLGLMTPESYIVTMEYRAYRIQHGEKITPDSFVIRDKFAPLSKLTNRPHAITGSALDHRMVLLHRKAGIPLDDLQPLHGLRHMFSTKVRAANVDRDVKRLLMGQSSDLDDTYDNIRDPDYQLMIVKEYMKAIDILTINPEFRMQKRIRQLEDQLKDAPKLEALQMSLVNKDLDIGALRKAREEDKKQMDYLTQTVNQLVRQRNWTPAEPPAE